MKCSYPKIIVECDVLTSSRQRYSFEPYRLNHGPSSLVSIHNVQYTTHGYVYCTRFVQVYSAMYFVARANKSALIFSKPTITS